jgi:hypothetical protein
MLGKEMTLNNTGYVRYHIISCGVLPKSAYTSSLEFYQQRGLRKEVIRPGRTNPIQSWVEDIPFSNRGNFSSIMGSTRA